MSLLETISLTRCATVVIVLPRGLIIISSYIYFDKEELHKTSPKNTQELSRTTTSNTSCVRLLIFMQFVVVKVA